MSGVAPTAGASHSHLFRGAMIRVDGAASPAELPNELVLEFSDGSMATAEVLTDHRDELILAVEGYTTRAGTSIAATMWSVRPSTRNDGMLLLRIGGRLSGL